MNKKIFSFLQEAAARWQNKTAIVHQDLSTTYVELLKDSQALAASLKRFGDFDGRGIAFISRLSNSS